MTLLRRIGKTQTIPFAVTSVTAVDIVLIFSGENTGTVYERWCYPARQPDSSDDLDWNELSSDSNGVYSGVLTEEATRNQEEDTLLVTLKAWDVDGKTRVKQYRVLPLASTPVETIEPNPNS